MHDKILSLRASKAVKHSKAMVFLPKVNRRRIITLSREVIGIRRKPNRKLTISFSFISLRTGSQRGKIRRASRSVVSLFAGYSFICLCANFPQQPLSWNQISHSMTPNQKIKETFNLLLQIKPSSTSKLAETTV